ncbi:hypothetical protein C463_16851 [Halorubrum californiense DSM 19288]|uniref:Uncharacterized protein n=1 Tax=Halorubrum californiense DSM 19288 TaxID=1227465 RepID=M0DZZ2_9EURY|nr:MULTISPECIES: hypothetical protein [Halorubrum]ELZ39664.1 hypothetical protein C463_16851 [Halorubrum californiense DSM 19288]TKX67752.1 hypothetical protein EXE40_14470 [Halorubrum sp. GN11GM_10-3_MGM]
MTRQRNTLDFEGARELLREELVDRIEPLERLDREYDRQSRTTANPATPSGDDRSRERESLLRRYERTRHEYRSLLFQYVLTRTLEFASGPEFRADSPTVSESDRRLLRQAVVCAAEEELPDESAVELETVADGVVAAVYGPETDEAA